jgi:hypothetical protein
MSNSKVNLIEFMHGLAQKPAHIFIPMSHVFPQCRPDPVLGTEGSGASKLIAIPAHGATLKAGTESRYTCEWVVDMGCGKGSKSPGMWF